MAAPSTWAGSLNSNEIFAFNFNMIISQQVFADNIGNHQTLVDKARVEGSLYGDTKLYYSTQVLGSAAWGNDAEAVNLLDIARPADPHVQAIELDNFRIITLTIDNYLSKRAFSNEYAFSEFNSVMLGWMRDTKRIYEGTLYNVFVGTTETSEGSQTQSITLSSGTEGKQLAESISNLLIDLSDYSSAYNDLGYLRSYSKDSIKLILNAEYYNKIKYVDTPSLFHREDIMSILNNAEILPARYFGTVITNSNKASYSANTPAAGKPLDADGDYAYTPGTNHANGCVRTTVECTVTVGGTTYHLFPGDEIPSGTKIATTTAAGTLLFGEIYIEDASVIGKMLTKLPPIMSAFETSTSFFNPRSLTENHYLIWGYNTLQYFHDKPFITLKKSA